MRIQVPSGSCLDRNVEFPHTPYDLAKAAERIRDTNYPQMKILQHVAAWTPIRARDARKIYPGGIDMESSTASEKSSGFRLTGGCNLISCVFRDKRTSPMRGVGVLPGSGSSRSWSDK